MPSAEELQTHIDECGFGLFQIAVICMTGGVLFAEGSEMIIMGSISTLLHDEWELSPFQRGFMVSVVFIGFAVGNIISGKIGDNFGRRPSILLAYALIGTFGMLTAFSSGPGTMTSLRFMVGVGCGIGFPSVYSLIPEVCPKHLGGVTNSIMIGFMPLGEAFGALGVILIDKNLEGVAMFNSFRVVRHVSGSLLHPSWRRLCVYSAIPAFVFLVFAFFFLFESPHFLRNNGRADELKQFLSALDRCNRFRGNHSMSRTGRSERTAEPFSWQVAVASLFGEQYFCTIMVLFLAHFTKDFGNFGLSYAFPQYFNMVAGDIPVGYVMLMCSILAIPGVLLSVFLLHAQILGKVRFMVISSGLCGILALGLLDAAPNAMHIPFAFMVKILAVAYFISAIVFSAEAFPVQIRNTALGICTGFGRLGSISAPLLFEFSGELLHSFDPFWITLSILMLATAICAELFLTPNAADQSLLDKGAVQAKTDGYGTA